MVCVCVLDVSTHVHTCMGGVYASTPFWINPSIFLWQTLEHMDILNEIYFLNLFGKYSEADLLPHSFSHPRFVFPYLSPILCALYCVSFVCSSLLFCSVIFFFIEFFWYVYLLWHMQNPLKIPMYMKFMFLLHCLPIYLWAPNMNQIIYCAYMDFVCFDAST